ncbi:MAG: acetyltransferase [Puniceicoccales bacterium]|jgi:sugar O-acyltransferase (sialic acid O-acetyltransferase NeuD family)|nr:acetyltransferase [Puniceicoccales bacterium]
MIPLVIVGDGEYAQMVYEYFTHDSDYKVSYFFVEKNYVTKDKLFNLPVIALEEIDRYFKPSDGKVFVAVTSKPMNRVRTRIYKTLKERGYRLASYVSSKSFVWKNAKIGENSFIFEDNTIQYHAEVGNNVVMWSGNHLGHSSVIKDNCFISSHVVISGYCTVEENCFLGVNASIADHITIARDNFIRPGSVILKNTEVGKIYQGNPAKPSKVDVYRFFKFKD